MMEDEFGFWGKDINFFFIMYFNINFCFILEVNSFLKNQGKNLVFQELDIYGEKVFFFKEKYIVELFGKGWFRCLLVKVKNIVVKQWCLLRSQNLGEKRK